jgi:hypothetical protein
VTNKTIGNQECNVSKQGFSVIVAGPELAKAMPKMFKVGKSYVVANASVLGERTPTATKQAKPGKPSKPGPKQAKAAKQTATPKTTTFKTDRKVSPDNVVKFVKANPGCNMTQIEVGTKMPQADIRKALNTAREAGSIRTEGQRRGLRYFPPGATTGTTLTATTPAPATASPISEPPAAPKGTGSKPW